jgi:TPP-dependent pyruvate/acetoin dehydrogenase alpha subunit
MSITEGVEIDSAIELYNLLFLIRRSEEKIVELYPSDEMKTPMHMSMGQEAIAVGACMAIGSDAQIFSSYRSHAAFLARTQDVDAFFAELYGKKSGTAAGKAGSMHLADPVNGHMMSSAIVAGSIPVAVGAAFAAKRKMNSKISCVFFGDGATDEGVFWESLNIASLLVLPIIFISENNGLAVHTNSAARRGYKSIINVVRQYECTIYEADGTNAEEVLRVTGQAVKAIRCGDGPVFIEFECYRYLQHVGIFEDFDIGYRPRDEYDQWRKRDPILTQRHRLLERGMKDADLKNLEEVIDAKIAHAVASAQSADFAEVEELHRGVFYEGA